jgi:hypothetical protein
MLIAGTRTVVGHLPSASHAPIQMELVENRLGALSLMLIGENFIDTRQDINLKIVSMDFCARESRVKNNRVVMGDHDFKIFLKAIWIFLDKLDVIPKILNLIKWPHGEEYCIVLSLKTKS